MQLDPKQTCSVPNKNVTRVNLPIWFRLGKCFSVLIKRTRSRLRDYSAIYRISRSLIMESFQLTHRKRNPFFASHALMRHVNQDYNQNRCEHASKKSIAASNMLYPAMKVPAERPNIGGLIEVQKTTTYGWEVTYNGQTTRKFRQTFQTSDHHDQCDSLALRCLLVYSLPSAAPKAYHPASRRTLLA